MNERAQHGVFHLPVLNREVADLITPVAAGGVVIDTTFGGGGHTRTLMEKIPNIEMMVLDRDPEALANVATLPGPVTAIRANFGDLESVLAQSRETVVSAVLFDLGVSSHQLDSGPRGFSYHEDGPLDMRMGRAVPEGDEAESQVSDTGLTAEVIVNTWSAEELERVIRRFGEDPNARRIARGIVAARPISTTRELAQIVAESTPAAARGGRHPARRTFQAIRMSVNDELSALERGLEAALASLDKGGRCLVIAYHSLEDRLVKRRFARGAVGCVCPPGLPECGCGRTAELRLLTRKPIRPDESEIASNPRSRSARLRAVEVTAERRAA